MVRMAIIVGHEVISSYGKSRVHKGPFQSRLGIRVLRSESGFSDFRFCMTYEGMIGTIKYFVTAVFKNDKDNN